MIRYAGACAEDLLKKAHRDRQAGLRVIDAWIMLAHRFQPAPNGTAPEP